MLLRLFNKGIPNFGLEQDALSPLIKLINNRSRYYFYNNINNFHFIIFKHLLFPIYTGKVNRSIVCIIQILLHGVQQDFLK